MKRLEKLSYIFLLVLILFNLFGCKNEEKGDLKISVDFINYNDEIIKSEKVFSLEEISFPEISRSGYTFNKWDKHEKDDKVIYKANFIPNKYKISFNAEVGNIFNSIEVTYDSPIGNLPIPVKENYIFIEWQYNGVKINDNSKYTYDNSIVLNAIWKKYITIEYYDYNDELIKSENVKRIEDKIEPLMNRKGYTFSSWDVSEEDNKFIYKANYVPNKYTISFDTDGGNSINSIEVMFDQSIHELPVPEKNEHEFFGWLYNGKIINEIDKYIYEKSIELIAIWIGENYSIIYYDFDDKLISHETVGKLEDKQDSPLLNRRGYNFIGWEEIIIHEKLYIYKALYKPKTYTIYFHSGGGNTIEPQIIEYGTIIESLPIPLKSSYKFTGWYYGLDKLTYPFEYNMEEDLIISAKWSVFVEYIDYNNTLLKSGEVELLSHLYCEQPERKGYKFSGWEKKEFEDKIQFQAKYTANQYNIIFVSNSTNGISSVKAFYDNTIIGLPTPTKANYYFMGWYLGNEKIETPFVYNYLNDITLIARWEKSNFPSVTYDEFITFINKTDNWLKDSKQYNLENNINVSISANIPNIGTVRAKSYTNVILKIDKENHYFESYFNEFDNNPYYDILRLEDDIIYNDIINVSNGKYILTSQYHCPLNEFTYDETIFNNTFNQDESYRKIGENHYLAYTTLGALDTKDDLIGELSKQLKINKEIIAKIGIEIEIIYSEKTNQFAFQIEMSKFTYRIDDISYTLDIKVNYFINKYNEEIIPFDYNNENVIRSESSGI